MKTKSRGAVAQIPIPGYNQYYNLDQNGDWVTSNRDDWVNVHNNGSIATITYDDTIRHGKMKRTRKCDHTTCELKNFVFTTEAYTDPTHTRKCRQKSGSFGDTNIVPLPASLSSVHSEALSFFESGCTEREFDLAVNLVEWESTVSLFRAIKPSFQVLKNLLNAKDKVKTLNYGLLHLNKKIQDVTFKDLANLHLSYEFGIKPLLKDIEGLFRSLTSIEEKFAWLRKNQGKPVKVRFSKDLSTVYKPAGSIEDYDWERFYTSVRHYSCKYNAFAIMVYDVSKLNDAELAFRLFARMAGMDSVFRNLWELTPWSFAIDWILDVGTWIESFDPRITLPYKFLDLGWSIHITESLERWKEYKYPIQSHLSVYGYSTKTHYYREPGLPVSFSSIASGSPGVKQLALGFSLLMQKMHK